MNTTLGWLKSLLMQDYFVGLPATAQALFFHMLADAEEINGDLVCYTVTVDLFKAHAIEEDYRRLIGAELIEIEGDGTKITYTGWKNG